MLYWSAAVLALGFLIIVHEAGHYFVARWCGMRVERFSIGFGPGILKRKSKSGTVFQLAPIPFGGFVEIRGMNIVEEVEEDDLEAYPNRPAWQRFVTILAGPATNYISAVILAFGLFTLHGVDSTESFYGVESVLPDHDAAGKLEQGDRLLAVDGEPLFANRAPSLTQRVKAKQGAPVTLTIRRAGAERQVIITPKQGTDDKGNPTFLLGIRHTRQQEVVDVGVVTAAGHALAYPVEQSKLIVSGLYKIVTGEEKAEAGGPVRITEEFKRAFETGLVRGIELLMMLSVYLGLFNLLPLPALDGGRLVFLAYEMVTRRRANPKIEAMVHMGGIMVLGVLMILVTVGDCRRFF